MPRGGGRRLAALLLLFCLVRSTSGNEAAPSSDGRLALVISLCRHGDRSPLFSFPSDRLPLSRWPDGAGQLTPVGVRAHYDLGRALRARYVDDLRFLSPAYRPSEVHVRSTALDRTLMSAYAQLAGLFPAGSASATDVRTRFGGEQVNETEACLPGLRQAVPIRSVPREDDGLLIVGGNCPRWGRLMAAKRSSRAWRRQERAAQDVLRELTAATDSKEALSLAEVPHVFDTWTVQRAHGVPLPLSGAPMERLYNDAGALADWSRNLTNAGVEAHRLRAGLLLHEVAKRARIAVANAVDVPLSPPQAALHRRFVVLSAHDSTMAAALAALGVFDGHNPPYNSTLVWEFYAAESAPADDPFRGASVRILFNRVPVQLASCGGRERCPLNEYLGATEDVTPTGAAMRARECLTGAARLRADFAALFVHDARDEDDLRRLRKGGKWRAIALAIVLTMISLAGGMVCRRRYAKRARWDEWVAVPDEEPQAATGRGPKSFSEANMERAILV